MSKSTSLYLRKGSFAQLVKLAASRNYTQTRGPGTGETPSVSQLVDALATGELVAIGPVARWRAVLGALEAGANSLQVTQAQEDALWYLHEQIVQDANLDDDDV